MTGLTKGPNHNLSTGMGFVWKLELYLWKLMPYEEGNAKCTSLQANSDGFQIIVGKYL